MRFRPNPLFAPRLLSTLLIGALLIGFSPVIVGQTSTPVSEIIYDNSGSGGNDLFTSEFEFGDEVILKSHPPNRQWILTDFLFEYFGDFTPQGDEKARIRLYLNDGPKPNYPPKTLLFDSGEFALSPGYQVGTFNGLSLLLSDDGDWTRLTWTVQFAGMRNVKGDRASLILRPETEVGHNFKDLWINNQNGWTLSQLEPANPNFPVDPVTNPDPIEKFGARMFGTASAPLSQPKLNIQRKDDSLVLEWTGAARLQASDSATTGYTNVPGATSPHNVKIGLSPLKFWRLVN